jgi:hypothetical protein
MGLTLDGNLNLQRIAASFGTSQNDYNPTNLDQAALLVLAATAGGLTLTGLQGGVAGRLLWLVNGGTNSFTLTAESASSTAANRFTTGPTLISDAMYLLVYLDSRWKVVAG